MNTIQQLIDSGKEEIIELPPGEYEGPFYVKKSCCIAGNFTTLWTKKGPVFVVEAPKVSVKDVRIEITEIQDKGNESFCVQTLYEDTEFENVEVAGSVKGVALEEGFWDIPKTIELGEIPAGKCCSFQLEVTVPTEVFVSSSMKEVEMEPKILKKGKNTLTITVGAVKADTYLYGDFLFSSSFVRRVYVSGAVKETTAVFSNNKLLYTSQPPINVPPNNLQTVQTKSAESSKMQSAESYPAFSVSTKNPNTLLLQKGQRIACNGLEVDKICIEFDYTKKLRDMEIDPYVFLLDKNNKAAEDDKLVFFGNKKSKDTGVEIKEAENGSAVFLHLNKIDSDVERLSIAYAIYGENPNHNFSKIVDFRVKIKSDGVEKMIFQPEDLFAETTIVAVEFYRYQGKWKINTVGAGYKDGLKRLCESYGLSIE